MEDGGSAGQRLCKRACKAEFLLTPRLQLGGGRAGAGWNRFNGVETVFALQALPHSAKAGW
jgi:hypothetical protein